MGLKKRGGEVFFCNNWQQFAKYYCIGYGSYLVFKYEGNSKFIVVIIDSTSAEISYPPNKIETTSNSSAASERAKAAANEFKTNNPSFVSTIKNKRAYIPLEFASKYLKPDVHLKLQNSTSTSNGQKWKAYCKCHNPRSSAMRIAKGFAKFVNDNDLLDGDTCVFELIKRGHPVLLQVTSFRAADYAN